MSNSTTKTRSSAPSRSSSSAPKRTSAPSRSSQASSARRSTQSSPSPSANRPHDAHVTRRTETPDSANKTTPNLTQPTRQDQSGALNRLENGKQKPQETKLQTGQDGMVPFEDKTQGGAAVKDHADRIAGGFADAFGPPQQEAGYAGQQASGGEAGGAEGGGGGGFMDKLLQLAQVGGDIATKCIEAAKGGAQQGAEAAQQGIEAAGQAAGQSIDKAKEVLNQAMTRFDLTDQQKQDVAKAMETLKQLAGEDGRWNQGDYADNLARLKETPFAKINNKMKKGLKDGLEESTGKPVKPPTPEEMAAAQKRWDALTPEQQEKMGLGLGDMIKFQTGMNIIKARAKELGLPESKFENGLSVNFVQSVLNNDPGWRMMLNK